MKALTLRLDDAEYEALRVAAFERRTTITALIREALRSPAVQVDAALLAELRKAAHVNHPGPNDTSASFMAGAAKNLRGGFPVGGSNVTAAVARVLDVVAAALRSPVGDTQ